MRAYVIKNKEGKYYRGYDCLLNKEIFVENILDATIEDGESGVDAEFATTYDIVPITICEGDLEEENRVLKKTLESVCCGYVKPNVYGTDIWEEAEKCGGLEQYFIQQTKESERDGRN